MVWPSPRFRTLIDESVRLTARVPTCVAPRGGRVVNFGSQRMEDAVVSWVAMRRVERASSVVGAWWAVVKRSAEMLRERRYDEYKGAVVAAIVAVVAIDVCSCSAVGSGFSGCDESGVGLASGQSVVLSL